VADLAKLNSSAVQAALDEFDRIGREAFLSKYGYGKARSYFVENPVTGTLCDSKAIFGAAFSYLDPLLAPLTHGDFSGGDATVAERLRALGFRVHFGRASTGQDSQPWAAHELALIVADYLAMLTLELNGQPYKKAERRRRLITQLDRRSESAIEFKHCNISSIMIELGYPYIAGYQPRSNVQGALYDELERQLHRFAALDEAAIAAVQRPVLVQDAEAFDFDEVLKSPPPPRTPHQVQEPSPAYTRRATRRDYLERETMNRSLGNAGELFALKFEKWRLAKLGFEKLSEKVEHVSATRGDGLGFDILSFEPDGKERFVEVKTTSFGQTTPFFVSANEAAFAREKGNQFRLYRLYDFRKMPRLFELPGAIEKHCRLDPSTYRAQFT